VLRLVGVLLPSHVVPTVTLFGSGPRRMKTPVTVKLSREVAISRSNALSNFLVVCHGDVVVLAVGPASA
jgi:hypothetical protein